MRCALLLLIACGDASVAAAPFDAAETLREDAPREQALPGDGNQDPDAATANPHRASTSWIRRWGSDADTSGFDTAGFGGTEVFRAVDIDDRGNVWVVGTHAGAADGLSAATQPAGEGVNSVVARLSPDGSAASVTPLRGPNDVYVYDVATAPFGAIVCGGFKEELRLGEMVLRGGGRFNAFVAAVDSEGAVLWLRSAGRGSFAVAGECVVASDGAVWTIGTFAGSLELGRERFQASPDTLAAYAARIDPDANVVQAWRLPMTSGSSLARGVAPVDDESGDVLIAGSFDGELSTPGGSARATGLDGYVARVSPSRGTRWLRALGSPGDVQARGVLHDPVSGTLAVAGSFGQTLRTEGLPEVRSAGEDDLYLLVLEETGEPLSLETFGGVAAEEGAEIARKGDAWLLCGSTRGRVPTADGETELAGDWDILLVEAAPGGFSAVTYGGPGEDRSYACEHREGVSAVSGWFSEAARFGGLEVVSAGDDDAVVFVTRDGSESRNRP